MEWISIIVPLALVGFLIYSAVSVKGTMGSSSHSLKMAEESIERSKVTTERNLALAEQTLEVRKESVQVQKETNLLLRELISKIEQK